MCVQGVLLKTGAKSFRVAYQSGGMALPVGQKSDLTPNVQLVATTLEPTSAAPSERKNIQDSERCYR